jgi:hypothetical protein
MPCLNGGSGKQADVIYHQIPCKTAIKPIKSLSKNPKKPIMKLK